MTIYEKFSLEQLGIAQFVKNPPLGNSPLYGISFLSPILWLVGEDKKLKAKETGLSHDPFIFMHVAVYHVISHDLVI